MLLKDYIQVWWELRPRKLGKYDVNHWDLCRVEQAYDSLRDILKIKRRLTVYVVGKTYREFGFYEGKHIYRRFYSVIFLANTGDDMVFHLAHEMFHEYQREQDQTEYENMTQEEREIEADAFAVAYCEHIGMHTTDPNKAYFLPQKIDHVCFSEKTKSSRTTWKLPEYPSADCWMPSAVREKADAFAKEFGFNKPPRDV